MWFLMRSPDGSAISVTMKLSTGKTYPQIEASCSAFCAQTVRFEVFSALRDLERF